jgi:hypothetical protein
VEHEAGNVVAWSVKSWGQIARDHNGAERDCSEGNDVERKVGSGSAGM